MSRVFRWRDLLPGVLALAVLAALVLAVLLFARVGALRGDTVRIIVLAGSVRDVLGGSEVWIAGQKVGVVRDITYRDVTTDTAYRLALTLDVLVAARPQLRQGTRAQIRSGGSLLGAPIVELGGGRPGAPLLQNGDTIRALSQLDPQSLAASFSRTGTQIPALRENIVTIVTELRGADGTFGAAFRSRGIEGGGDLGPNLRGLARRLNGDGTVGRLVGAEDVARRRTARALARADSLRLLLDSPTGTVGRFRRDSTLAEQIAAVRDEVTLVRALIERPVGTVGRGAHDRVLAQRLTALEAELGALMADVRARPLRYVVF